MPVAATGLADLKSHVAPEFDPEGVANKLSPTLSGAVKGVLIEHQYVDKDYRSTYYNFYAKKGQQYRTDCVRLHFFDGTVTFDANALRLRCADDRPTDHYFGYVVIRPTGIATIGRSVVSPDVRVGAPRFIVSGRHKVHLLGYDLEVWGFPSMDQHIDISVCAHVACWAILRHYSQRYRIYREFLTHDITVMAQEFNPGGLVPSRGLQLTHAERVFQEGGTFPVLVVQGATGKADLSFYRQLLAYVDSGFPLFAAMHDEQHAIAVVGYGWRKPVAAVPPGVRFAWDELECVAVVDDNHAPYHPVPLTSGAGYAVEDIDSFIVALPEKVYYPADAVEQFALKTLFAFGGLVDLPPREQTIIRHFITTAAAFRKFVRECETEFDPSLVELVMTLPFAQFIWVVEFATEAQWHTRQISARAIIDATASLREVMPLWLFFNRTQGVYCDRRVVPGDDLHAFAMNDLNRTGFTMMAQNLRATQTL